MAVQLPIILIQLFAPGDNHHKDPTIVENKGEAYLRVKMEITDANGEAHL